MNKQQYAAIASSKLLHAKPVLDDTNLNKTFQDINKILRDSTKECIPAKKRNNKKPKLKVMSPAIPRLYRRRKKLFITGNRMADQMIHLHFTYLRKTENL